jgi:RND superfamily putative drug exporter
VLPATKALLDDWNWSLPRWLEWLPRVTRESRIGADEPRVKVHA